MIVFRVLLQTVVLAFDQIRVNKVRAALTSLGIIIGVASVTAVIAGLTGMRANVLEQFDSLGARKMWVWGHRPDELRGQLHWHEVRIKDHELAAIEEHVPSIDLMTPSSDERFTVASSEKSLDGVQVTGIWPTWHEIEDRYVIQGRTFIPVDEEHARQVCLVNDYAIEDLRLPTEPVGENIMIAGRRFLIIGVVETTELGGMFGGGENDSRAEVFIPYATAHKIDRYPWPTIVAQLVDPDQAEDAKDQVRFVMRNLRELAPGTPDTFRTEVLQQHIDRFNSVAAGITLVASGVVSISLLVGGIGIMNIMLVSVSERTREIGLRKAVGARPGVVLAQFLTEAVTLCLVGGLAGLAVGQALTLGMQNIPGSGLESAQIPAWAIVLALGFSAGVGIVFGMFPAVKAARLDPIAALRKD